MNSALQGIQLPFSGLSYALGHTIRSSPFALPEGARFAPQLLDFGFERFVFGDPLVQETHDDFSLVFDAPLSEQVGVGQLIAEVARLEKSTAKKHTAGKPFRHATALGLRVVFQRTPSPAVKQAQSRHADGDSYAARVSASIANAPAQGLPNSSNNTIARDSPSGIW